MNINWHISEGCKKSDQMNIFDFLLNNANNLLLSLACTDSGCIIGQQSVEIQALFINCFQDTFNLE